MKKYAPGNIIKYTEKRGLKRTLYGIITENPSPSCIVVLTERGDYYQQFMSKKISPSEYIVVNKILSSYNDIPINENSDYKIIKGRTFLKNVAKMVESYSLKNNKIKSKNNVFLEDIVLLLQNFEYLKN